MKQLGMVLLAALSLSACAHIKMKTPTATIYPPEVATPQAVQVAIRADPARLHTITNDASARPPVFSNFNEGATVATGDVSFGITDQLQLTGGVTDLYGVFGQAQFQFLGRPWAEGEVGWSAAIHGETHIASTNKSGDQKGEFGPGGYNWKASSGLASFGLGASTGYRWGRSGMVFAGVSANSFSIRTKIDQEATDTDPGGSYSLDNKGSSWASGLGLVLGSGGCRVVPTVQWVEYKIDDQREHDIRWGLSLEFGGSADPAVNTEKSAATQ